MKKYINELGAIKFATTEWQEEEFKKVGFKLAEEETNEPIQEEVKKKPKTKK